MTCRLLLFCLVDGESPSNAFSVKVTLTDTIHDLKEFIKAKKTPEFDDFAADKLTLWRVSIPVLRRQNEPIVLHSVQAKKELLPTDDISDIFRGEPPKKTIHIIVKRPGAGTHFAFTAQ
ncbi:hypothetical protein BGZ65_012429, partial [Modicella reniformis]